MNQSDLDKLKSLIDRLADEIVRLTAIKDAACDLYQHGFFTPRAKGGN